MGLLENDLNLFQIIKKFDDSSVFDADIIKNQLDFTDVNVITAKSISSTNTVLKTLAELNIQDKTVLIADTQTGGRGRLGKSFYSPNGTGLYMSVLLRKQFSAEQLNFVTPAAAVAVATTLDNYTDNLKIKWVNDIYLLDKKVCGILTEASFSDDYKHSDYLIIGIGINLVEPSDGFSDDIKLIATPLFKSADKIDFNHIVAELLNNLFLVFDNLNIDIIVKEYTKRSYLDGNNVIVTRGDRCFKAVVVGLDSRLNLIVKTEDGNCVTLASGDVSIRSN